LHRGKNTEPTFKYLFRRRKNLKKLGCFSGVIGILALAASSLYAGGIINKQNQSADYIRTLNRHAATDYADIAVYNPAGIMKMDDGAKVKLDAMYFAKDYSNTVPDGFGNFTDQSFGELDSTKPSIVPGFFSLYKKNKWAGFFAFTIPAGGGKLDYKDGNARTVRLADGLATQFNGILAAGGAPTALFYNRIDSMVLEVKQSSVLAFTFGGSYKINKIISVAGGVRYSDGTREFDGNATFSSTTTVPGINNPFTADLNIEQKADGWAGILGVNLAPVDKLNIGVTYISKTKLDYKNDVKRDTILPTGVSLASAIGFGDGTKTRIDIPALLGLGASYRILPQLKVDFNYVYYFEKDARIDTFEDEGNSWDAGMVAEYRFSPKWLISLGYQHTNIELDNDQQRMEPEEPKLDANIIGTGFVWNPIEKLAVTVSGLKVWYDGVSDSRNIKYEKDVWSLAAGVQFSFF
jgi:long-chain fatty acid transport protein